MTIHRTTPEVSDATSDHWAAPMTETQASAPICLSSAEAPVSGLAEILSAAFGNHTLIDGEAHPADDIIAGFFKSESSIAYPSALENIILRHQDANLAAATLQCAARFEPRWPDWRKAELVRNGLQADDIGIRDAAVRAAEGWICADVIKALKIHRDKTPWLQEYIDEVIADADCLAAVRGAQS